MIKLIVVMAALLWFGDYTLPMFTDVGLMRESALALMLALPMLPWIARQFD